jgi:hypothetical protein
MHDDLWMHIISCEFVYGGVSTSATFKSRHININWILPWGIEMLVLFINKRVSRLHAHGWNGKMQVHKK